MQFGVECLQIDLLLAAQCLGHLKSIAKFTVWLDYANGATEFMEVIDGQHAAGASA